METFEVTYHLTPGTEESVEEKAEKICLEQSAELPRRILTGDISTRITGKVVDLKQLRETLYEAHIAWPLDNVDDISQFLNVLYGNISLQTGIRIIDAQWSKLAGRLFKGPRYGIGHLRKRFRAGDRPLSATALKPMGLSAGELAARCYEFASGGIDIIKDDHGLTNQSYAPFEERVKACVEAVHRAGDSSDRRSRSRYFPNITAFAEESIKRYEKAASLRADGVLLCPHITGLETMHRLVQMDIDLPIIAHPAFSGALTTTPERGLSPDFLYGQLWRALGADFVIYPNTGGRFSYTRGQCEAINRSARTDRLPFHSSFPMPAGGIQLDEISHWKTAYGDDTVFLLGGSLYEYPGGLQAAAAKLRKQLDSPGD